MKKSYTGLILWFVFFIAGYFPIVILCRNTDISMKLSLVYCTFAITLLSYIIYKFDKVYWYNGVNFEDAEKASFDDRQLYALKHFKVFLKFSLGYSIFAVISYILKFGFITDIAVFSIGIVTAAIYTIKFKLN